MPPGHMIASGSCWCCRAVFFFDPDLVPSIEGNPICQRCVETINPERVALGLPAITYQAGAYP